MLGGGGGGGAAAVDPRAPVPWIAPWFACLDCVTRGAEIAHGVAPHATCADCVQAVGDVEAARLASTRDTRRRQVQRREKIARSRVALGTESAGTLHSQALESPAVRCRRHLRSVVCISSLPPRTLAAFAFARTWLQHPARDIGSKRSGRPRHARVCAGPERCRPRLGSQLCFGVSFLYGDRGKWREGHHSGGMQGRGALHATVCWTHH